MDRNKVFGSVRKLKNTTYVVREDLPQEILEKRKKLYPVYKNAVTQGQTAKLTGDKLTINGIVYSIDTIHRIPQFLPPPRQHEKVSENTVAFFGEGSVFSNFHQCVFKVNSEAFTSVEEFYQSRKALHFNRPDIADKIREASHPSRCKRLGDSIQTKIPHNTEKLQWMKEGVRAKFSQNENLRVKLLETHTRQILESGPDLFWGTGVTLSDASSANQAFAGKNSLGQILMAVREELKG